MLDVTRRTDGSATVDPGLVPFAPPEGPLPFVRSIRTFLHSYIESFPRATYEQPSVRFKGVLSDVLFVCDPALIHEFLVTRADEFQRDVMTKRAFAPILSESSLLLAEGAEWRFQRRAVAPHFRPDALLPHVPVFAAMALRQAERWRSAPRGKPVDAAAAMTRTTLEIIMQVLLGDANAVDPERFEPALTTSFDAMVWHSLLGVFGAPRWTPFPGRKAANSARDYLHAEMKRLVAERRSRQSGRDDLLDRLFSARDAETGRSMDEAQLATNLLTFIAAGHETTAVGLTWALWLIARDQEVQDRVADEARALGDGAIDSEKAEQLTYTRQVFQEAMRLYPPIPAVSRQPLARMQIGGYDVSPSTELMVPIFSLHRHKLLWDNPLTFDPDRFAPERVKARPRFAYLPFGAGPRVCVGATFAMLEGPVVLATLARAFRFRPLPGHSPKPVAKLSLRPDGGMPLLIEPR